MADPYATLGVSPNATPKEIKSAFRQIAQECHPDRSGEDEEASDRFKAARAAYELLMDPKLRARHDRRARGARRASPFNSEWSPFGFTEATTPPPAPNAPKTDLDLDDLFGGGFVDFGFGSGRFGGRPANTAEASVSRPKPSASNWQRQRGRAPSPPTPGHDVFLQVDISTEVADGGGSILVSYARMRRKDGSLELYTYDEIHDLRIPPGVEHGASLRVPRMGHAGPEGGAYGELVADIRIVTAGRSRPDEAHAADSAPVRGSASRPARIRISVQEALLGARIELITPCGKVRLKVPACTSSGRIFRFLDKGAPDTNGEPTDFFIEVSIVTPESLDEESQELIRRFGERNPHDPRDAD
jgi:curved DNA-binding protein